MNPILMVRAAIAATQQLRQARKMGLLGKDLTDVAELVVMAGDDADKLRTIIHALHGKLVFAKAHAAAAGGPVTAAALGSLRRAMAFDSRDWSTDDTDAWMYGILLGWDEALSEVAEKHGWDSETIDRITKMHEAVDQAIRALADR